MKITDNFHSKWAHLSQNQHFVLSKDEWYTNKGTGKSMKSASYVHMAKGNFWAEVMSKSKNIKPIAIAIVELHKSEGIKQAGSYLVS